MGSSGQPKPRSMSRGKPGELIAVGMSYEGFRWSTVVGPGGERRVVYVRIATSGEGNRLDRSRLVWLGVG